jgi:hypothetical protein
MDLAWTTAFATPAGQMYLAAVALLFVLLRVSRHLGMLFFIPALPATLAHEAMHLLAGLLSNGQPSGLRLLPRRSARGFVLGSVTCNNVRWYNGLFIGLAPLLLLPAGFGLLLWRVQDAPIPSTEEAAWVYAIASLGYAGWPSWQDIKVATASSWLLVLVLAAASAIYIYGTRGPGP